MTLTPAQERHLRSLEELTAPGGPIGAAAPTATHLQPQNLLAGRPSLARARLRKQIIRDFFAQNTRVKRDRQAVIMAGPPGAGKSSAQRQRIPAGEAGYWRVIDPDEFKLRLLRHAIQSGEYEALVPERARQLMEGGEEFAPGEFAALVHEESSALAKMAAQQAFDRGERVVVDGVHASPEKIRARIAQLAASGYIAVDIICVDGPREATRARVIGRWADAYARYTAGGGLEEGLRARYVPEHITAGLYADDERFSACAPAVAQAVRSAPPGMDVRAEVYYVAAADRQGEPWKSYRRDAAGFSRSERRRIPPPSPQAPASPAPTDAPGPPPAGDVFVAGYQRADGSHVAPHTRRRPAGRT